MRIPDLAEQLIGRIRQSERLPDHYEVHVLVEDVDGEPLGEVAATAIRTDDDDPYSVRARAFDRALTTIRALGYEGQVTVTDEYGGTHYDAALGDPTA